LLLLLLLGCWEKTMRLSLAWRPVAAALLVLALASAETTIDLNGSNAYVAITDLVRR
jgi:hypothetical protein